MPSPKSLISVSLATAAVFGSAGLAAVGSARADVVAYLVNVTVRPGYNFANADDALAYGHGICGKVAQNRSYADLVGDVKADFNAADDYQGAYLINQAVNELCPALIWQLRNSAAGYYPAALEGA